MMKCILCKLVEVFNVIDWCFILRINFLYFCYIICGNIDRNIVYN